MRLGSPAPTVLVTACLLAGCSAPPSADPEPALATPLSSYDTEAVVVQREEFCEYVGPDALRETLGGVVEPETWHDGDRIEVGTARDVVQEFGCRWVGEEVTGSAWVLAPPVTRRLAGRLLDEQPPAGCHRVLDAPAYGDPSAAQACTDGTVRFAGLFGDAWLTCELAGPDVDVERAGRWCVGVAEAAAS